MQLVEHLLTAKIRPPRIGVDTIWRQRLFEKFDGYKDKKLTVVSAPTGYGKTVLISQFASQVEIPVVWYQLDGFDNDLTLFIRYFIAGISRKIPHFGLQILDYIDRHKDVSGQIRSIAILLANELEARAEEGLVFIFDDYHLIDEGLIHQFIEALLACLPEDVHLVIASRYVLPLNLVRMKAHGLVNEITCDPLKFSREEIKAFFDSRETDVISEDVIELVESETDGWPVALSLMKSALLSTEEGQRPLSLTRRHNREEVYRYLAEEVFYSLPVAQQTFLTQTSVLDVMTPEVCNRLMERQDARNLLEDLLKRNIFLMKLEGEEEAYRYHHLFRDFLQERLGAHKNELLEKAGQYYFEKERFEQAVEYHMAAGACEKAAQIIEQTGMDMLKRGKWQTVNRWMEKMPKTFQAQSPWFILMKGVVYSYKGMWHEALAQIDSALERFIAERDQDGLLNARLQRSSVLRRAGALEESLAILDEILPSVSMAPIIDWYDVLLEKVNILLWQGGLSEAVETLKHGIEVARHEEEHRLIAYFMEHLGATYYATGEYYKALEFYEASKERYLEICNPLSEVEMERYSQRTTLARIYRDWGELDRALGLIREEIDTKERLGLVDDLPRAYHQMALIYNDLGEKEEAEKYFRYADDMYRKLDKHDFQWTWHLALYGKILIDNGKREKGEALTEKALKRAKEKSDFNLAVCEYIASAAYIGLGRMGEAVQLLEHALEIGQTVGAKNLICQCHWLLANIYLSGGYEEKAKTHATRCFALAGEENYLQIFLSYEATSFPLIKLGLEMGIEEAFLEKLVLRLGKRAQTMLLELSKCNRPELAGRAQQLLLKVRGEEKASDQEAVTAKLDEAVGESQWIKVSCFGAMEVFGAEEADPVQWKTAKAKELFAYLVMYSGETVSRDKLLEDMWPDGNPEQTSKWLHTYVYQIRGVMKHFGIEKGVVYENRGYRLVVGGIASDVEAFENLVRIPTKENSEDQMKALEEAVRLYRGEYLEGIYTQWALEERRLLEQTYLSALERLAGLYVEAGAFDRAADCLHRILKTDPLLEKAHEMLMVIYEKMDDRVSAIHQYESFYRTLKSELGIEPRKQMKDLYERLH